MTQIKKYISVLSAILLTVSMAVAQTPKDRTTSTVIADVLAQLPAKTQSRYNQLMSDLTSTGEEGLLNLIGKLNPPGKKSNETIDYAISGWTNFVANDPQKSAVAAQIFEKALKKPFHDEIKAMLIRQLELIGNDNNISVLSSFLASENLIGPASQALAHFKSEASGKALLVALEQASDDKSRIVLVSALGQAGYAFAEATLINLLNSRPSPELKKILLDALSKIGTFAAANRLKKEAEAESYAYGKTNAATAYLAVLKRLTQKDPSNSVYRKEVENAKKQFVKQGKNDLKIAANNILLSLPSIDKEAILKETLKEGDVACIASVLNGYPYRKEPKALQFVFKALTPKKSPEMQIALLYWLGSKQVTEAIPQISGYLKASDKEVRKAAVSALAEIGTKEAMSALTQLLKSNDETSVALAQKGLENYNGDISDALASVFNDAGNAGKIAVLQLIAKRQMESQYSLVYNQMFQNNEIVKAEAANALQYVATDKNLSDLFGLLEESDMQYIPALQQAVNAALNYLPSAEQMQLVSERMKKSSKKQLYYTALANSESEQAMRAILDAYRVETGQNKQAAFEALKQWKSFEGIHPLLHVARNSKNDSEILEAVDAIVQKIAASDKTGAVKYLYLREAMRMAKTDNQKIRIIGLLGNTGMYQAMLLVAPCMDDPKLSEAAAQCAMNLALNNPMFAGRETAAILNKVSRTLNNPDAGYQRQSITKYLNENSNEGGYVSIFNGENLDGWKGLVENPIKRSRMKPQELAAAQVKADAIAQTGWIVENGELLFTGKGDNLCTNKLYGDFEMLVDWKLYEGPEPDAGIYLRGTPQVQIWDTARVNVGAQVGSGGLYNNQQNPSKPLKVADQKVGEWNTFRIRMIGDRVSVWLNGELVTDNIILENYWDRNQPIFPMEQIELQAHGSKVAYRDIFIREIPRPEPFKLSSQEEKEGFKVLFDGTNMYQWMGNTKDYVLEDGNIVMHPSRNFGGNLYTKEQFDNFVFRFEFLLTPGANNGLGIRTPNEGDAAYQGMELQILDNEAPIYKDLQKYQYHGSVYGVIPARRGFLKPAGEWNYQEVVADGDHIKVMLNGTVILDGNIREAAKNGTIDGKKHPGLFNKTGHIGFLGHGSEVKFRNIRIKQLNKK